MESDFKTLVEIEKIAAWLEEEALEWVEGSNQSMLSRKDFCGVPLTFDFKTWKHTAYFEIKLGGLSLEAADLRIDPSPPEFWRTVAVEVILNHPDFIAAQLEIVVASAGSGRGSRRL